MSNNYQPPYTTTTKTFWERHWKKALFLAAVLIYVLFIVISGNANQQKETVVNPAKECFVVGEDITGRAHESCYYTHDDDHIEGEY